MTKEQAIEVLQKEVYCNEMTDRDCLKYTACEVCPMWTEQEEVVEAIKIALEALHGRAL